MVLIEAEQKSVGKSWKVEKDIPLDREETREETAETEVNISYEQENFFEKLKNSIKRVFARINVFKEDFRTIGMTDQQKAQHYVKKSWNCMARNEGEKAKEAYDHLLNIYEGLDEGPVKTNLYHEVRDIYERVSHL